MSSDMKTIFFAYQGRRANQADENVDAIKAGAKEYNQYQSKYDIKLWEDYTKTTFISKEVLGAIDLCEILAADLTYFNHNVMFELGYAIAKKKEIIVFLNGNIEGASKKYSESFIKDLKYQPLSNSKDVISAIKQHESNKDFMEKQIKLKTLTPKAKGIFHIESQVNNQPSIDLGILLMMYNENQGIDIISDDRSEVQYQPLNWYFSNIYQANLILIHLVGDNIVNHQDINAFNSFWAGVSCGFDQHTLLVAPSEFKAPLDYYDILIQYKDNNQLVDEVGSWLDRKIPTIESHVVPDVNKEDRQEENLLKLGIGCEIAENERGQLLDYFVQTYSYNKAKEAESTLIIGRKGSGKSAIYIKLSNELVDDSLNYVVNLKPESDDLLYNIDLSQMYKSSKRNFFFTVWKCVILSQLLNDIYKKIKSKDISVNFYSEVEEEILAFHKANKHLMNLNFFGIVSQLHKDYLSDSNVNNPNVLEYMYKVFIGPIKNLINKYFKNLSTKKYSKIIVLADNLDKTWNTETDLSIQAEMIVSLLEVKEKIIHELPEIKFNFQSTIFLRKDIFEFISKHVNEPDKLLTQTHEINWEQYPEKLKELVDNRFRYLLELDPDVNIDEEIWNKYFDISNNKKDRAFDVIEKIITKRPRDLLYFLGRLLESAVNNNRNKVNSIDLNFAINNYTKFLSQNIIAEVRAFFPEIEGILTRLQAFHGEKMEYKEYLRITEEYGLNSSKAEDLVAHLFEKGYMLGYDSKTDSSFSSIEKLKVQLNEKRFFGLRKNKVYIIAHAKYYMIKNQGTSSF